MTDIRIHRYQVEPASLEEFVNRRAELITAMRAKHPGLAETRLIDLGDSTYIDTWRWSSPAEMGAAFADVANIPEARAAMSLTQNASAEDGSVIDAR
jgi:hypothetical protein